MKKNNDKMKWYILIAVALIVGAIIGYFATNSLSTTGNATNVSLVNEDGQIIKAPETYHPSLESAKRCCCSFLCIRRSASCCNNSNNPR